MAITEDIVARATSDLQLAIRKAEKARQELLSVEAEIADLQAFLRTLERYTHPILGEAPKPTRSDQIKNTARPLQPPGNRARDLVDVAIAAIEAAGRPLLIGDLLDAVVKAGHTLGGQDPKSNLAGYLSRDPRVRSLGRNVGWSVEINEEAASEPGSVETASSNNEGGPNDGATLTNPGKLEFDL